jgi:hypothetical protein
MATMIKSITAKLYSEAPTETIYHYTNFGGLIGIVEKKVLWASDILYMNDSAEMSHTVNLIKAEVSARIDDPRANQKLLAQFQYWVSNRITTGHMLFAASFRANGNLLSQWRGYSALGKGVSIGFNPQYLLACADKQSFQLGKCVYEPSTQQALIRQIIKSVETLADEFGENTDETLRNPSESYYDIFERVESDLLRIAAILKHPSFREEEEWRIVSPVLLDYVATLVKFREGTSMLVPYLEFQLGLGNDGPIELEQVVLGPTPNINLSMNSLTMFLSKMGVKVNEGISYCQIPYRQR